VREFLHRRDVVLQRVTSSQHRENFPRMVTSPDASSPVLFGGTRLRPVERLGG
jgi:hypothetical protein